MAARKAALALVPALRTKPPLNLPCLRSVGICSSASAPDAISAPVSDVQTAASSVALQEQASGYGKDGLGDGLHRPGTAGVKLWTMERKGRTPIFIGRRSYLVDTLALVKKLQAEGLSPMQAEAITNIIQNALQESLDTVAQNFTSKAEMQKHDLSQDAAIAKFKSEMQSAQEHAVTSLQREVERLKGDIEKMRSELRYEVDKVTAGQRLDLNLERGRIREELSNQQQETADIATRLDREIHTLKTQLEAAKYDVIKYCIGTIVSVSAVALGLVRILL